MPIKKSNEQSRFSKRLSFFLLVFESQFLNSMEFLNICKHFIWLISLPSVHMKNACEVASSFFLKINKEFACVSNFHPGLEKMLIIRKIWDFHPWLKFYLGLAKPNWIFNLVYWVENLTCNCNAILKRSFLISREEILTWYSRIENIHIICPLALSYLHVASCEFSLTSFMPPVSFHTPWKHYKTRSFLMFSRGTESGMKWAKQNLQNKLINNYLNYKLTIIYNHFSKILVFLMKKKHKLVDRYKNDSKEIWE